MRNIINHLAKTRAISAFNKWSETYNEDVLPKLIRRGYNYNALAKKILSYLSPASGASILEFGIGSGLLGQEIYRLRPDLLIIGIDISDGMLHRAKETGVYYQLIQCDAESIPLNPHNYNCAYSAFMMHSLPNLIKFLNEVKRVMDRGATLSLIDLFRTNKRTFFSQIMGNIHSYRFEYGALSNYLTSKEFLTVLEKEKISCVENMELDSNKKIARFSIGSMAHHYFDLAL